jgi:hypothetical protein
MLHRIRALVSASLLTVLGAATAVVTPLGAAATPSTAAVQERPTASLVLNQGQLDRVEHSLRRMHASEATIASVVADPELAVQVPVRTVVRSETVRLPPQISERTYCNNFGATRNSYEGRNVAGMLLFRMTLSTSVCQRGYTDDGTRWIKKRTFSRDWTIGDFSAWEFVRWKSKKNALSECSRPAWAGGERWCQRYEARTRAYFRIVFQGVGQHVYPWAENTYWRSGSSFKRGR